MKLKFNMGMRYIFAYAEEINKDGPLMPWQLITEVNPYLLYMLKNKYTRKGRKYDLNNIAVLKRMQTMIKL